MTSQHGADIYLERDSTRVVPRIEVASGEGDPASVHLDAEDPSVQVDHGSPDSDRVVVRAADGKRACTVRTSDDGTGASLALWDGVGTGSRTVTVGHDDSGDGHRGLVAVHHDGTRTVEARVEDGGGRIGISGMDGVGPVIDAVQTDDGSGRLDAANDGGTQTARVSGDDGAVLLVRNGSVGGDLLLREYPSASSVDPETLVHLTADETDRNGGVADPQAQVLVHGPSATVVLGRERLWETANGRDGRLRVLDDRTDADGNPVVPLELDGGTGEATVRRVSDGSVTDGGGVRPTLNDGLQFEDGGGDPAIRFVNGVIRTREDLGAGELGTDPPEFDSDIFTVRQGEIADIVVDTGGWRRIDVRIGSEDVNYVLRATVDTNRRMASLQFDTSVAGDGDPTTTTLTGDLGVMDVTVDSETTLPAGSGPPLDTGSYDLRFPNFPDLATLSIVD